MGLTRASVLILPHAFFDTRDGKETQCWGLAPRTGQLTYYQIWTNSLTAILSAQGANVRPHLEGGLGECITERSENGVDRIVRGVV